MGIYPDPDRIDVSNMPRALSAEEFRAQQAAKARAEWEAVYGQEAAHDAAQAAPAAEEGTADEQ
jgi:hypothetical protein